ncbi:MAG: family glycosyltransferase [Rhodocyclales bacterium]|nr:family glycosyltransferase [Rhodocyclales bacterium]
MIGRNLHDLTLIIPTYNRVAHLKRLLSYYQRADLPIRFLILDSSNAENVSTNAALIATCGEQFCHVHFPSTLPVATKLFQGLKLVATSYCAICADDDLIFPDGLSKAMEFLSAHQDYVCTDGIYLNFFPRESGDIQLEIEYASSGIDASHAGARVFRLFQRYESMFYAVFRTPDLRDIFDHVKDIPSLHYQELFQATAALLKGRSRRLPEFYAARQHCDPAEPTRDKWQTFYWFADNQREFLTHYQMYRESLWRFHERYGAEPRMEKTFFDEVMDMAHVNFFSDNCPPQYFFNLLRANWPTDTYTAKQDLGSVFDSLRGQRQNSWFARMHDWMRKLELRGAETAERLARRSVAREVQLLAADMRGWTYTLPPNLWWMASVPQFRVAVCDLCGYLGSVPA